MHSHKSECFKSADSPQAVIDCLHEFLRTMEKDIRDDNKADEILGPFGPSTRDMRRLMEMEIFFATACLRLGELRVATLMEDVNSLYGSPDQIQRRTLPL